MSQSPLPGTQPDPETRAVAERYARRAGGDLYSILRPEVMRSTQEWQRALLEALGGDCGYTDADLRQLRLVDVGCGYGGHLLDFLRMGLAPQHLTGVELLDERVALARTRLPATVHLHHGDASTAPLQPGSQDLVFQSVVFSSLLDDRFQQAVAERMWSWLKPGGWILWYDFVYGNPRNPDVRAVPVERVRALFPQGEYHGRRVTLAPPISRRVCRLHPGLYGVFNALPPLRTHVLAWIRKPGGRTRG